MGSAAEIDFFISYTSADAEWAKWIAVELERAGYTTILQAFDFRPGQDFVHQMQRAVMATNRTIAVLSPDYWQSKFSEAEWREAFARDPSGAAGILIPIRVRPGKSMGLLSTRIYIDLADVDENVSRARLLEGVQPAGPRPTTATFPGMIVHASANEGPNPSKEVAFPGAKPCSQPIPAGPLNQAYGKQIDLHRAMKGHVEEYQRRPWSDGGLALRVRIPGLHDTEDAKAALLSWSSHPASRVLVLSGEFGSGKTWLMRWLASELAKSKLDPNNSSPAPVPIFLRAADLTGISIRTREELLAFSRPLPLMSAALEHDDAASIILIDGLDELIGTSPKAAEHFWPTIRSILAVEPRSTRFILTCRRHVVESIGLIDGIGSLEVARRHSDDLDRTALSISMAFGNPGLVDQMVLQDVTPTEADRILQDGESRTAWRQVKNQPTFRQLSRTPFLITLLGTALNTQDTTSTQLDLPTLYERAVRAWLDRERASDADRNRAARRLEALAVKQFYRENRQSEEVDDLLRDCGITTDSAAGPSFRHYSLFEYFLAKSLVRELELYDSTLLRRLNLIHLYNVNRFAVPLLIGFSRPEQRQTTSRLVSVSPADFHRFSFETGWRKDGYGRWPSMMDPLGRTAVDNEFELSVDGPLAADAHRLGASSVTGISWYDAFQYCRWTGGRLPRAIEILEASQSGQEPLIEWSSSWLSEPDGWITAVRRGSGDRLGESIGLNPDLRLNDLGFRVLSMPDDCLEL